MPDASAPSVGRLRALDGLRGVASVVVVLFHLVLQAPTQISGVIDGSPLKLLTSGDEAVLVFFVLSGIVVALPALRRADFDWFAYVPQRLTRLMVPVFASVVLAVVMASVAMAKPGWVQAAHFHPFSAAIFQSFGQLDGPQQLNGVLWTMMWETTFSLLLPVYVLVAVLTRRLWWVATAGALVAVIVGWLGNATPAQNLPVFLLGTLIAVRLPEVRNLLSRFSPRRRNVIGAVLLGVALTLMETRWISGTLSSEHHTVLAITEAIEVLGAALVVVVVLAWRPPERALETRPVQWLGRISFSLYLVHIPVLYVVQSWLRFLPWWEWSAIVLVVSFVLAAVFSHFIEQPAHRLSMRVRDAVHARFLHVSPLDAGVSES